MSSVSLEEVVEEAKALPPDDQERLLELVGGSWGGLLLLIGIVHILDKMKALDAKELELLPGRLNQEIHTPELTDKAAAIRRIRARRIRGKYAHLPISSESFAARKAEEIALEDRRRTM
jgi:hypothetical protein